MSARIDRVAVAAALRMYADAVEAGTAPVPALRHTEADGYRLRVVPRVLHDALCSWRVASSQETDPVVLGCAGCGLAYPGSAVDPSGMTTGVPR